MVEIAPHEGTPRLGRGDQIFHLGRYVDEAVRLNFKGGCTVAIGWGLDATLLGAHLSCYSDPTALLAGPIAWGTEHRAS
jgi:hypothetical protein